MDYIEAEQILDKINSSKQRTLSKVLIRSAVRYAQIRAEWFLTEPESRNEIDLERTSAHETLIGNCNALSRSMASNGEDVTWRKKLGNDRKNIGDFACFVHLILGIKAR